MTQEQVYVALKRDNDAPISASTKGYIGPGTVIGVFAQPSQVEKVARQYGEYRYASDMELNEPMPEVIIYTSYYDPDRV